MTHLTFDQLILALLPAALSIAQAVLRIAVIVFVGAVCVRFIHLGLKRLAVGIARHGRTDESIPGSGEKRAVTLTGVIQTIAVTAVWAIVAVIALAQVGLDVAPILAGAGIIGLAVGFGAQNLVRDLISGFFIVLEDQVRMGDVAVINGTGGQVEMITFRTITLRDFSGVVHVFPNGIITTLSNMTKGWSAFVLDMGVSYKEDTDHVSAVMRRVGEDLRADPVFGPKIIEPIEIVGVENFADSSVVIRVRQKTIPIEQWNVGREYRRRLKKAFDAEGIEIPFPQRVLRLGETDGPLRVHMVNELAASGDRRSS
jgi:small conductance mechanosensitive channel